MAKEEVDPEYASKSENGIGSVAETGWLIDSRFKRRLTGVHHVLDARWSFLLKTECP